MMFRSDSNTTEYFLRDYVAIAMVISRLVTLNLSFSCVKIYMLFAGWEVRIYRLRHRKCDVRIFIHELQNF